MSLQEISRAYIQLLDDYFAPLYRRAKGDFDHIALGEEIARYPVVSRLMFNSVFDIGEAIEEFWATHRPAMNEMIRNSDGLKCLYSGDISPLNAERLVKRSALYVDTVVIPDPLYNIAVQIRSMRPDDSVYLSKLIRHVFNVLKLRDALTAQSKYPIALIAPLGIDHLSEEQRALVLADSNEETIGYAKTLFRYSYNSCQEIFESLATVDDVGFLLQSIAEKEQIPSEFRTKEGLQSFLEDFKNTRESFKIDGLPSKLSAGQDLFLYLQSQVTRTIEHRFLCDDLVAEPIYDLQRAWFFMNRLVGGPDLDAGIIQSLQSEPLKWLGNIPIDALKSLREGGELEYLRQTLRSGLHDLKVKKDTDLTNTFAQVQTNIQECFKQHDAELKGLESKVAKLTKQDLPITVANGLVGWVPVVGNFLTIPGSIRDLKNQIQERGRTVEALKGKRNSIINFLMKAKDGN